jgi:hypothetical protein
LRTADFPVPDTRPTRSVQRIVARDGWPLADRMCDAKSVSDLERCVRLSELDAEALAGAV